MKQFFNYESIPNNAIYLGSEYADGTISESLDDSINEAIHPVYFKDDDGVRHYFDLIEG